MHFVDETSLAIIKENKKKNIVREQCFTCLYVCVFCVCCKIELWDHLQSMQKLQELFTVRRKDTCWTWNAGVRMMLCRGRTSAFIYFRRRQASLRLVGHAQAHTNTSTNATSSHTPTRNTAEDHTLRLGRYKRWHRHRRSVGVLKYYAYVTVAMCACARVCVCCNLQTKATSSAVYRDILFKFYQLLIML